MSLTKTISDSEALEQAYERLYSGASNKSTKCNIIKTLTGEIEFTHYGSPKTLKPFKKGIVLLGITTSAISGYTCTYVNNDTVLYDFYDITGSKHISSIQGKQEYKILEKSEDIPNTQDTHTSLIPCSILASLKGADIKTNKPSKPVKLKVTIQYIELSGGVTCVDTYVDTCVDTCVDNKI